MTGVERTEIIHGQRSWWRRVVGLLLVAALVLLALPVGLRWGGEHWLNKQPGMVAHIGDVDLNLFSATLQLNEVELQQHGVTVLAARKVLVAVNWWPLWQRHVHVERIMLEQGQLSITGQDGEPLVIAGFSLPVAAEGASPELTDEGSSVNQASWGVHTGDIFVNNFQVRYQVANVDLDMMIRQITVAPMLSWLDEDSGAFLVDMTVNGGDLELNGTLQPFSSRANVASELNVTGFKLETLAPLLSGLGLSDAGGTVNSRLNVLLTEADEQQPSVLTITGALQVDQLHGSTVQLWLRQLSAKWDGEVAVLLNDCVEVGLDGELVVADVDFALLEEGLQIKQQQLHWNGVAQNNASLMVQGSVTLDNMSIQDLSKDRQLVQVGHLSVDKLHLDGIEQISAEQLQLQSVQALQRTQREASNYMLALQSGTISSLALNELNQFNADLIHVTGLQLGVSRMAGGAMELQQWFPATDEVVGKPRLTTPSDAADGTVFGLRINRIQIDEHSGVRFDDNSLAEPVALLLSDLQLSIDNLDSGQPQQPGTLALSANLDKYSRLVVNGSVKPFASSLGLDLSGTIRDFNLPCVSPYVEQSIGHQLQQGQLDLDFDLPVADGKMALESDVYLRQFRITALSEKDDAEVAGAIGLPVNLALSLLRNRDGDIHLALPVHGDLSDPSLHIGPVVRLAVANAVKNTVLLTLAPLGIVASAGELIGIGGDLTFDRVVFEPGTGIISQASLPHIDKVADLLAQRPQLVLAVCGCVTADDIEALQIVSTKTIAGNKAGDNKVMPSVEIPVEQLQQLVMLRAEAVKDALLAQGTVVASQLLLCKPQADVEAGMPGVDLTLQ
ncbi:MAG: DUF748 domain-containing protein [Thermodesulfobacteriota bacterium]|nr:DUF748 domain-containing protein [Thermodesulfobacteriota bacterium]